MTGIIVFIYTYWSKHLKKAVKLMTAGIIMTAIIVATIYQFRAIYNHSLHYYYDSDGMYEIIVTDTSDTLIQKFSSDCKGDKKGRILIAGKAGIEGKQFTCGFLDDEYGLAHIPLEKGRLPESADETAIDRYVLNQFGWAGSIGDTIKLDSGVYKVVGIIDNKYGQRVQTEINTEALEGAYIPEKPLPVIFLGSDDSANIAYSYYMFDNIGIKSDEDAEYYTEMMYNELGDEARLCSANNKNRLTKLVSEQNQFRYDIRWILILSGMASFIAALSVISILRIIIIDRKNNINILRRLGTSKKQIFALHALECMTFTVIQTIIGALFGLLAYYALNRYQKNIIGLKEYNGFTNDDYVVRNTYDPYLTAIIFSVVIMVAAYLFIGLSCIRVRKLRTKIIAPKSLTAYYLRIFRQSAVSLIQFISLTIIGFSVVLGYMYYTDNGKEYLNGLSYLPPSEYEINNGFDLKEDNIAEYYLAPSLRAYGVEAYDAGEDVLVMGENNYSFGVDDNVVSDLGDVTATGYLKQTFIISETEKKEYNNRIQFRHDDEKEFIINNSNPKYKDFFDEGGLGTKYLYRFQTKLTNKDTISELEKYVTDGSISYENIANGSEILVITGGSDVPLKAGSIITVGSVAANSYFGIEDISSVSVRIGAVIVIPDNTEKILKYVVCGDEGYNFLTTAIGAKSMGLHNAVYTEIFSGTDVDGGLIPSEAGMSLFSYEEVKGEIIRDKLFRFGGLALVIILMSLLGFSAYFSSIGIKIQTKNYHISVLRALGDSISHIRRHLFISNLIIPLSSGLTTTVLIRSVQYIIKRKYSEFITIHNEILSGNIHDPGKEDQMIEELSKIRERYFLDNELWKVPTERIVMVVFGIMIVITFLLTAIALLRFRSSISNDINKERKRT